MKGAWDVSHNGASGPGFVACSKYSATTDAENEANARLIAAAPDLLDELKSISATLHRGYKMTPAQLQSIDRLIQEATGKT